MTSDPETLRKLVEMLLIAGEKEQAVRTYAESAGVSRSDAELEIGRIDTRLRRVGLSGSSPPRSEDASLRTRVRTLLLEGRGTEAIGAYRKATGCDLATARRAMEAIAAEPDEAIEGSSVEVAPREAAAVAPPSPSPVAADRPAQPALRWQPVEAPPPQPRTSLPHARPVGFLAPGPRPGSSSSAAPRPPSNEGPPPTSSDLTVVFALALLVASLLAGGLVLVLVLGR